jgi:hypothetical protein
MVEAYYIWNISIFQQHFLSQPIVNKKRRAGGKNGLLGSTFCSSCYPNSLVLHIPTGKKEQMRSEYLKFFQSY